MARYYLGFSASDSLAGLAEDILDKEAGTSPDAQELRRFFDLYATELLHAFLLKPSETVGVSPTLHKVVEGAAGTIGKAWQSLLHRLQSRADVAALSQAGFLIGSLYPQPLDGSPSPRSFANPIESRYYQELRRLSEAMQGADPLAEQQALIQALYQLTDILLEGMIMSTLNPFEPGFLLRKLCDGMQAASRAASHQVIQRVVAKLDAEQIRRLGAYNEGLIFELD